MRRIEFEIGEKKIIAKWDSRNKCWIFELAGRIFKFGKKYGDNLVEILKILESGSHHENHMVKIKRA